MTAEETLKKHLIKYLTDGKDSSEDRAIAVNDAMIEFAQVHVEAALKSAAENVEHERHGQLAGVAINKDSILNAYPKELIT